MTLYDAIMGQVMLGRRVVIEQHDWPEGMRLTVSTLGERRFQMQTIFNLQMMEQAIVPFEDMVVKDIARMSAALDKEVVRKNHRTNPNLTG